MKKTTLKLLSFLILITLLSSTIITANTTIQKIEIQNINPKIQEIIDKINETLVRNFMEYLVLETGSRYTGTYGCQKAAKYIYQQFENMGIQTRYQNWSSWGNRWNPGLFKSQNIIGTKPGTDPDSDEIIIFNAHYDTVKETAGAIDDGSGTVGVLAAAYVLSQYSFKRTMEFVTFSGEEIGLCGSHAYARELYDKQTPVLVEFNADEIGKATSKETGKSIRLSITEDSGWIADTMEKMTKDYGFNFNITRWGIDRDAKKGGSDYFEFIQLGYESVAVWQGEWDPYMHTPQDNINNVNFSYLVNTTRHIAATMAILADMDIEQPQIYIANPRFGKIFFNDNEKKTYKYKKPIIIDETNIYPEVKQGTYPIKKVEFYYDNKLLFTDTEKPYEYMLNKISIGFHKIKVIAYDTIGNNATDEIKILFLNILKNN
ncbi:MAG: M28 family peptidase [Candidatus Thermoplasmatota archaeon]|nr:M28 family peptidase [Candidatus Thermoplasmatota archaeon]